jgi:hypothetical protein
MFGQRKHTIAGRFYPPATGGMKTTRSLSFRSVCHSAKL